MIAESADLHDFGVISNCTKVAFPLLTFAHLTFALLSHPHCWPFCNVDFHTSGFALVSFALLSFTLLSGHQSCRHWAGPPFRYHHFPVFVACGTDVDEPFSANKHLTLLVGLRFQIMLSRLSLCLVPVTMLPKIRRRRSIIDCVLA